VKQNISGLGDLDILTQRELKEALGHQFDSLIREWYRGTKYVGYRGSLQTPSGTVQIPGPESGYFWSLKLIAVQFAGAFTTALNSGATNGKVTGPTAGQIIDATANLTGTYTVTVTVYIDGTVTPATDDDNMQVTYGSTVLNLAVPSNGTVATYTFTSTLNNQSIAVKAIAAGSAGAVYHAMIQYVSQNTPPRLSAYVGESTAVAPVGSVDARINTPVAEAVITWSSNQVILKDQQLVTLYSGGGSIATYVLLAEEVPAEMQGKL